MSHLSHLIVSDLHLGQAPCPISDNFFALLDAHRNQIDHLIIAGDLFDAWIGDDAASPFSDQIADAINQARPRQLSILPGNRDFLLGQGWQASARFQSSITIQTLQRSYLVNHGDEYCTSDHDYQQWRSLCRQPQWQKQFLALPISDRINQVKSARDQSRQRGRQLASQIADIELCAWDKQPNHLIHGHTHRAAIHRYLNATRVVLGDWRPSAWVFVSNQYGDRLAQWNHGWQQSIRI